MSRASSRIALTLGLALGLALLRLIHLGADTPSEFSRSAGPYVDEGYKTLSPRNLVLFGTTHWNSEDTYRGWMEDSPITQWSYYAGFRLFGATIEVARSVTILFFALLLIGFAWAMSGRYGPGLVLGGLALLGLDGTLFFFSRIAIFEVPIAALLCGLLFVFARLKPQRSVVPVLLALAASVLLVFGVKLSALLYVTPILFASSLLLLREEWFRKKLLDWRYLIPAAVGLFVLLALTRDQSDVILAAVRDRLHLVPSEIAQRILENPLVTGSPAVVLAGFLCAVHGLICRPDLYLGNVYRLSLVAMVLFGVPLIALFEYDPLRYYAPLLPAFVLIVLEWVHLGGWKFAPRPTILSRVLQGRVVASVLLVMLALFVVHNARELGSFFLRPSFQAQQIRSELAELIPEDSIVAGVWAPFIALGTSFKTLYIAPVANPYGSLPELAPDYILHTVENRNSEPLLRRIQATRGMSIGESLYVSKYNEETVILYPLIFTLRSNASIRRGPFAFGRALARAGDPEAAEQWLRRSLLERKQEDPRDPLRIAEALSEWGACLVQLGRHNEAEELLLGAYETYRPSGSAPARELARLSLKRLVVLYEGWDRPGRSAEYRSLLEGRE